MLTNYGSFVLSVFFELVTLLLFLSAKAKTQDTFSHSYLMSEWSLFWMCSFPTLPLHCAMYSLTYLPSAHLLVGAHV